MFDFDAVISRAFLEGRVFRVNAKQALAPGESIDLGFKADDGYTILIGQIDISSALEAITVNHYVGEKSAISGEERHVPETHLGYMGGVKPIKVLDSPEFDDAALHNTTELDGAINTNKGLFQAASGSSMTISCICPDELAVRYTITNSDGANGSVSVRIVAVAVQNEELMAAYLE